MNALLLWILGILGVLITLWGLTRLPRGGLAWMGFGLVLGLAGLGGAWLHQQYGTTVFWGLGILGVLLLVWALLNLRSRLAGWSTGLAVLLALTGFGSIVLLNSSSPNLLTSGTIPNPLNNFQTDPATPPAPDSPTPTPPAEPAPTPRGRPIPAHARTLAAHCRANHPNPIRCFGQCARGRSGLPLPPQRNRERPRTHHPHFARHH